MDHKPRNARPSFSPMENDSEDKYVVAEDYSQVATFPNTEFRKHMALSTSAECIQINRKSLSQQRKVCLRSTYPTMHYKIGVLE